MVYGQNASSYETLKQTLPTCGPFEQAYPLCYTFQYYTITNIISSQYLHL